MENLEDYIEKLYEGLEEKVKGSFMILQLCRNADNLEHLIQNGAAGEEGEGGGGVAARRLMQVARGRRDAAGGALAAAVGGREAEHGPGHQPRLRFLQVRSPRPGACWRARALTLCWGAQLQHVFTVSPVHHTVPGGVVDIEADRAGVEAVPSAQGCA